MSNRPLLFANNANTVLAAPLTNVGLSLTVSPGAGVLFPTLIAGQSFKVTLADAATGLNREIVLVTAKSVDTFTIIRAQEGTAAQNWLAGDIVANLDTAGAAAAYQQINLNTVPIAGLTNVNVVLNALQYGGGLITLAGVLTGNIDIEWPDGVSGTWLIQNNTTGAYTVSAKTVSGATRIAVAHDSQVYEIISNGTEVLNNGYITLSHWGIVQRVTDTGAADAYVGTLSPTIASYVGLNGLTVAMRMTHVNTGASTLNLGGGAIGIRNADGNTLAAGDIDTTGTLLLQLDEANNVFIILGAVPSQLAASSATTRTGTAITSFLTPSGYKTAQSFSAIYAPTPQTITLGSTLTLAHGLSQPPVIAMGALICTSADNGYTAGQRLLIPIYPYSATGGTYGIACRTDGTNIYIMYGATNIQVMNPSTWVIGNIDVSKWTFSPFVWG